MNLDNLLITEDIPLAEEFIKLRITSGMSARGLEASKVGLKNSFYSVTIREKSNNELIGMGRVIGDGGTAYQIADIVIHPDFQRQGLGTKIMSMIMNYIENSTDPLAYINLIADGKAVKLYEKFGFVSTSPKSHGMFLKRK